MLKLKKKKKKKKKLLNLYPNMFKFNSEFQISNVDSDL